MRYRHLEGSPYVGNVYNVGDGLEWLRSEAITAFRTPTSWKKADTYTRDGFSFDAKGQLVAVGGWSVEEVVIDDEAFYDKWDYE